jgi:hypothetical protein
VVALPLLIRPGERDNDAVTTGTDRIEAVVPITEFPSRLYPPVENRTGLVGALSRRGLQEP